MVKYNTYFDWDQSFWSIEFSHWYADEMSKSWYWDDALSAYYMSGGM